MMRCFVDSKPDLQWLRITQINEDILLPIENFGKNASCAPRHYYLPNSHSEVLDILARHRGQKIRVVGRLHSWSDAPMGNDVLLDLRKLNETRVEHRDGKPWAIIQAGCQIKRAIAELENKHGLSLPALGLITEQSIAGAAATGTHGSGRHSLSHYIDEVTIAIYDAISGEPTVQIIREGDKLAAARCSLGCLGVILAVGIQVRESYNIEQHFHWATNLQEVLANEIDFPLQQFFFIPFRWDYLVQCRRESKSPLKLTRFVHQIYWFVGIDVSLHIVLIIMRRWLRTQWGIRLFFSKLVPFLLIRNWKIVDKSQNLLTMQHELFRHIEIEIFVLQSQLSDTLRFVQQLLQYLDGDRNAIEPGFWELLKQNEIDHQVRRCEPYLHHYPICIRKVLSDATLISMASSEDEPYYAISFISYDRPSERDSFFAFAELLTQTTSRLFNARPHWGKYSTIDATEAQRLYPRLNDFRDICESVDPQGNFRNEWAEKTLFHRDSQPTSTPT